ncbi:MAG: M90 family metallopeptidase [Pseudomonadota bacterium]
MQMSPGLWGMLPIAVVILAFLGFRQLNRWRHARIVQRPMDPQQLALLQQGVPIYQSLSAEEQQRLQALVKLFLADKHFYGCAGLEVTERMRITIAGEACLLILNQPGAIYPGLSSILIYPSAFRVDREQHTEHGTVVTGSHRLLGESWDAGKVILSWDDVANGVSDFSDGHNVVLHEFAHQLDSQYGTANGSPRLRDNSYKSWARVLSSNFENLQTRALNHLPTVMDTYGATNPAEFFAVATETFFEKPDALHRVRPDLYEELQRYYGCDPRLWQHGTSRAATDALH